MYYCISLRDVQRRAGGRIFRGSGVTGAPLTLVCASHLKQQINKEHI